ncbi:MAG: glycosyltransferase family 4 protein [Candidatus Buchananbacteria bacterium]|nr:glycosyltransferase family 4 protein [Candidatus Buchananbacteria bacterium]
MRVLIFSLAYLPFVGGAELAVKEITDRLRDIEFDMLTVDLDGKQQPIQQIGNVKVHRVGKGKLAKYLFPFAGFTQAVKMHQIQPYDAVWAIMANQSGLIALRFKKKFPSVKYLLTLQEGDSLKRIWSRTFFMRPFYKKIYRTADHIQSISTFLEERALKYGYAGAKSVVPNGVDLEKFKKEFSAEELAALRQQLNLSKDDKVIITTSRLVHKNGVDTLIQAVKDLPVKLLILGSGELEIQLKSLAQEIGVRDKILFLGHIDQQDLPKYLKLSNVYVRASRSEGLGSAFLEAMAAGLPVIGTNVGGIPDFLKDGENGFFCEVNNPRDLANKIQLLLGDENLSSYVAENGRAMVFEKYDWRQIADEMKNIFNHL